MLHLFNKVYLEFDDRINVDLDRVVVSERYGLPMADEISKFSYGLLLGHSKNWDNFYKELSLEEFIIMLKRHSEQNKKKLIIYCDRKNYIEFAATWLSIMMPKLDYPTYRTITDLLIYRERCVANTQLSSQNSIDISPIFESFTEEEWKAGWDNRVQGQISPALMGVNLSYEFLLANYLAGDRHYVEPLLKTSHMFLRRFFQEQFTDNRQMVLLNINNHRFQDALGFTKEQLDIQGNPLKDIPELYYYHDPKIWKQPTTVSSGVYGICELSGLTDSQIEGLKSTILRVFDSFEGMLTNSTVFEGIDFLDVACREGMTQEELDELIELVSDNPFDTCFVPRFDYENLNFPLFLHILRSYHDGDLNHLKKMIIHSVE